MKIPIVSNYITKKILEGKISQNDIKLLREKTEIQKTIIEQRQKINDSIINITKPKNALSPELYLNNDLYKNVYSNGAYSSGFWGFNNSTLRKTSRIAYWESSTGRSIIDRFVDIVVGAKLDLQAEPIWEVIGGAIAKDIEEHKNWTRNTEARFKNWAKNKK